MKVLITGLHLLLFITTVVSCKRSEEHVIPYKYEFEKLSFDAEKDGREISFSYAGALLQPLNPTNAALEITATSDSVGMIKIRLIRYNGLGTYILGQADLNNAVLVDSHGSINAQSGAVFIYSNKDQKISGVFNFKGVNVFTNRTVTVNKGKFTAIPISN
ncbi:MAG TPA: DUF6252 family protein [Cytophagaceae bacterium]|jgi:hypothetical protein